MSLALPRPLAEWVADNKICKDRILGATSSDGRHWTRLDAPCIDVRKPPPFDDEMVYGCHVARLGPHTLQMHYQSSKQTDGRWRSRILRAFSVDGAHWSEAQDTGIASGSHGLCAQRVQSPYILRVGARWLMYFAGTGADSVSRILAAESHDRIVWRIFDRPILEPAAFGHLFGATRLGLADPSVVGIGRGGYRMFVSGALGDGFRQEIVSATSIDGLNWSADDGVRLPDRPKGLREVANNPAVIAGPNGYRMWFRATDELPLESDIHVAASSDSLTWRIVERALRRSRWNRYERHGVGFPFVLDDAGIYRMFYAGYWGGLLCGETVRMYRNVHRARRATGPA